jgi:hypothetical protein
MQNQRKNHAKHKLPDPEMRETIVLGGLCLRANALRRMRPYRQFLKPNQFNLGKPRDVQLQPCYT